MPSSNTNSKWRPEQPETTEIHRGTVDFFNDTGGYGFIRCPSFDEDTFYHMEDIGGRDIKEGTELEFVRVPTEKGPRATHVRSASEQNTHYKTGGPVTFGYLEEGMYISLKVDRKKGEKQGLSKHGSVHIDNGGKFVGENVVVRITSIDKGYVTASVETPTSDTVVRKFKTKQRKKTRSRRRSRLKSIRRGSSSNPFKNNGQKMRDLVRKKL